MAEETQAPQAAPAEGAVQEQKTKKVNRLTTAELDKKIGELEGGNHVKSVYYKHLLQRKKEMAGS